MEACLNKSHDDFDHDNASNMSGYQERFPVTFDFTQLLEEIDKADDLEGLEDIEQMLQEENQKMAQSIKIVSLHNAELKDELNTAKCLIKEFDELHNEELQKIEILRGNIQLKQKEVLQEQKQQVDDLDQFELDVTKISDKFVSAPKEFEKQHLNMKIDNKKNVLEERKNILDERLEKLTKVEFQKKLKESMDLPLAIYNDVVSGIKSSNSKMIKSIDKMTKEVEKLRFDIKTNNFTKFNLGKK